MESLHVNKFGYKIKNNQNLHDTYKDGKGLIHSSDLVSVIIDFHDIKDGEKYKLYKPVVVAKTLYVGDMDEVGEFSGECGEHKSRTTRTWVMPTRMVKDLSNPKRVIINFRISRMVRSTIPTRQL